ncbi:MAG: hypothetical protein C0440_05830 [Candidatus Pelagibacter sp.]|nr:hypothetical protein [Candidatus Pelagibacter sp.]
MTYCVVLPFLKTICDNDWASRSIAFFLFKAQSISQQYSFDDNLKISSQGMQNLSKHQNSDEVQSFVNNHQASVSETARQSESAQKHFDESKRLSHVASDMEDDSVTMNRNMNDKFIGWLGQKPPAGRHDGHMGERAALFMIHKDPELAQSYAQEFQREKMASMGYGSSLLPTEKDLRQSYESQSLGDVVQKDAVSQLSQEAHALRGQNLHSKVEGMEERVTQGQSQGQQFMDQSKHEVLDDQRKEMSREFNSRSNNIGVFEVMGSVVDTAVQTVARPAVKSLEWAGMMDMNGGSEPRIDYTNQFKEMETTSSVKQVSEVQEHQGVEVPYEGMDIPFKPQEQRTIEREQHSSEVLKSNVKDILNSTSDHRGNEIGIHQKHGLHDLHQEHSLHQLRDVNDQKRENVMPYAPHLLGQSVERGYVSASPTLEQQESTTDQQVKKAKVVMMKQDTQNVIEDLNQPTTLKKEKK